MTIPEIHAALNELHERACKAEALLEKAQADIDELRAQIGVERYPQPPQPYDCGKNQAPNGIIGGVSVIGECARPPRY